MLVLLMQRLILQRAQKISEQNGGTGISLGEIKKAVKEIERVILNNGQIYVPQIFWL